ncbi:hypothetical protein Z973_02735 [Enterococcus faecium VRE1044]|nr:hypothetical protein Z973_02735 [Enterococcus faecium VRE1044]
MEKRKIHKKSMQLLLEKRNKNYLNYSMHQQMD